MSSVTECSNTGLLGQRGSALCLWPFKKILTHTCIRISHPASALLPGTWAQSWTLGSQTTGCTRRTKQCSSPSVQLSCSCPFAGTKSRVEGPRGGVHESTCLSALTALLCPKPVFSHPEATHKASRPSLPTQSHTGDSDGGERHQPHRRQGPGHRFRRLSYSESRRPSRA